MPQVGEEEEPLIGESAQNDHEEPVQGSSGSLIQAIASVVEELTSTANETVTGAAGRSLCRGSKCGSSFDARVFVLIIGTATLIFAIALLIRVRRQSEH
jgi:hypothetical protein